MVRQLEKEYFNNYAWMDRSNVGMGRYVNLPFAFADLDDLCKDIEKELDSQSLGAGFTSQGQKIDAFAEHRGYLLRYINDVLYDIADYLETPLYKGFNDAMDHMAGIDMTDGKTDNTIGLQTNVSVYGGGRGYGFENDMSYLTLEDFIGNRYQETEGSSYESTTYNQKVEGFADLFAEDYENLVKSGKINGKEVTLEKYLDSLVLKEFAYKKDSPFYLELIELLSELTVVIPIYEAAAGKTLITNDYLTDTEGAFKIVSATVNLVTLGQGALISEGGMAFAKMFASEVLAEAAAGSTAILSDKAGAPSSVTIALSLLAGAGTGMAANKVLFSGYGRMAAGNVIERTEAGAKSSLKTTEVTPPGSNHPVKIYTDGNAQINTGKIDTYMRGKVELDVDAVKSRINDLKNIKKTNPANFNKNMKSELKSFEDKLHNYQRSQEMSKTLNNAGILDNAENNQMIAEELLEAAKSAKTGNTEIISYIEGSNGNIQVVSRWKILDDDTPYLATVILKPIK